MSSLIAGRVLVVDDDDLFLRVCRTVLRRTGLVVDSASSAGAALEQLRANQYDAIVTDIRMPGGDGLYLLRSVRALDATLPVVLMTGAPTLESAISAVDLGAHKYLPKPFDVDQFIAVVTDAVRRKVGVSERAALEARLQGALERLWMAFQPLVSAGSGRVIGYEALLRSGGPGDGMSPLDVLELAERTARIFDVGRAIRARVAADIASLDPSLLVFVNLHPVDLEDPDLYSRAAPLSAHAERVVLEITERSSVAHLSTLDEHMKELRALGFRVAVDDLGAGYAGLTTFARVRPEYVKLDASLVRGIDTSPVQQLVVTAVLDLARELSSNVVAEAIETPQERDALVSLGVDLMQGYYFAQPARPFVRPALLTSAA